MFESDTSLKLQRDGYETFCRISSNNKKKKKAKRKAGNIGTVQIVRLKNKLIIFSSLSLPQLGIKDSFQVWISSQMLNDVRDEAQYAKNFLLVRPVQ
jgi:hypothetical protein